MDRDLGTSTRLVSPDCRFQAYVKVNGEELRTYPSDDDGPKRSTGWVASQTDQRYTVHIEANHPGTDFLRSEGQYYSHLSCAMYIDGVYRNNPVQCFGKAKNWITPIVVDIAHARVSRGEVAAMIFGRPRIAEHAARTTAEAAATVGTIRIALYRARMIGKARTMVYPESEEVLMNEKDKKLQKHSVTKIGQSFPKAAGWCKIEYHPQDEIIPFFTFNFKHKIDDLLRADGIIGGSASKSKVGLEESNSVVIDLEEAEHEDTVSESRCSDSGDDDDDDEDMMRIQVEVDQAAAEEVRAAENKRLALERLATKQALAAKAKSTVESSGAAKKRKRIEIIGADGEEDKKAVLEIAQKMMGKRLKREAKKDGGVVDLTE